MPKSKRTTPYDLESSFVHESHPPSSVEPLLEAIDQPDPDFSWCDSNSFIQDTEGNLSPAGTCLKINDYIMFLNSLTHNQLLSLRENINQAIAHELNKRGI